MDGVEHVVKRLDRNEVIVELIKYKQTKSYNVRELEEAWDEERLAFEDPGKRLGKIKLDLGQLTEEENRIIKLKLKVLEPVIKGYYHTINLDVYLADLRSKGIEICKATFYNWKQLWEDYGDARFLLNGKPGPKKRRTEKEVLDVLGKIMDENIYGGEHVNYHLVYGEYKDSINKINELREIDKQVIVRSFQTVWRIIKEKRDRFREQKAREGHVAANLEKSGSQSTAS
jgi:putative transposase